MKFFNNLKATKNFQLPETRLKMTRTSYPYVHHDPDKVYRFILHYKQCNDGAPPTYREIMAACNISSSSVVKYILQRLVLSQKITLTGSDRNTIIKVVGAQWIPPSYPFTPSTQADGRL